MNLMQDTLASGRQFRTLNLLGAVMRECPAFAVDMSSRLIMFRVAGHGGGG